MTEDLRLDGKPFILDHRGRAPRYVIEDGEDSEVLTNQFTGKSVKLEERTRSGFSCAFRRHRRNDQ